MLNQPTMDKLQALRLTTMAQTWQEQNKNPKVAALSFDERFAILVDAEHMARDNRRIARLIKEAQLRINNACIEDIDASAERGLEKTMVRQFASCAWIRNHLNIVLTGKTGVGKSYVACAVAQNACRNGYRVQYRRVPRLLEELALARADGSYARCLARFAKADVLVLDDWGLGVLKEPERHDLLEVVEDRYGQTSTVITAQLPVDKWHLWIGDPTIADAILDRLVRNAYKVDLTGPTRRPEIAKAH